MQIPKEKEMLEDLQRYKQILKNERLGYEETEFFTAGIKNLMIQLKQRGWL